MANSYAFTWLKRLLGKRLKMVYYQAKESIGEHKRAIVVNQVELACQGFQETRDEFQHVLTGFNSLALVSDKSLEHKYHLLNRQFQYCRAKSEAVSNRIKAIEEVSEALFNEWEKELAEYTNRSLRNASKQQLKIAKQHYTRLIKAMHKAEAKIAPVLAAFKDQVLFLKHNLNAKTIAGLQNDFIAIGIDISQLILAMEQIIAEANEFVSVLAEQELTPKSLPGR
ncbi:DUF2959 family protein [Methylocucumis oryzae]|uniref:DUF2959 domain-containing protein n=1 Tax=Methylocucumis oryzae TaxID=1632867 RepID=A0A0F3IKR3_9GAMM|nr:DUF2959 family protein [Methylocucumis oryzae]KJV07108.1 hypothetical protein VZ94_06970 [Methylocucumis oryzae]